MRILCSDRFSIPRDEIGPLKLLLGKGRFLSESEIDISNCQTHVPNHYLKIEILKLSSITVKCCISVSVLNFIHQDVESSNNVYLFQATDYILGLLDSAKKTRDI